MTKLELILLNDKKELSNFSFVNFCLQFIHHGCQLVEQNGKRGYKFENEFYSLDLLKIIYEDIKIQNNFIKRNIRKFLNFFRRMHHE
jgi:hypothetical protein